MAAKIYGPHLEDLAREWSLTADPATMGGEVHKVLSATLSCREHRTSHEVDVVAIEDLPDKPPRVTAIGEVKVTKK